jgi:hypothetical protein
MPVIVVVVSIVVITSMHASVVADREVGEILPHTLLCGSHELDCLEHYGLIPADQCDQAKVLMRIKRCVASSSKAE